jgi:hypothetical protein
MADGTHPLLSDESRSKQRANTPRGDNHPLRQEKNKGVLAGGNNPRCDTTIYHFVHKDGMTETCTRYTLYTTHKLVRKYVRYLVNGKLKTYKMSPRKIFLKEEDLKGVLK